ncbi:MAG TPA: CHRD domain-containing protein [Streptosporangiaceae bacterium]
MNSRTKRRLARGIGAVLGAAAASATLATSAASANSDVTPPAGISVPGDSTGAPAVLVASLEGRNEVTAGATNGQALELIGLQGNTLSYSVTWRGIGTPTEADIHAGVRGVDGPVVVPLFTTPPPASGLASGTVTVTDSTLLAALRSDPGGFYTDLHTTEFPGGAARAQLHLLNHAVSTSGVAALQESVVLGSQIYACTPQPDGSFAFTQNNVEAHLTGGIHHTFVQPVAGPPQWQAPDGSAVTGTVVTSRNANGAGNIAELNLDATQIGASTGLLAHVVEVLRLNTVGGVAPTGSCDPQATPTVNVPYQADYVFING